MALLTPATVQALLDEHGLHPEAEPRPELPRRSQHRAPDRRPRRCRPPPTGRSRSARARFAHAGAARRRRATSSRSSSTPPARRRCCDTVLRRSRRSTGRVRSSAATRMTVDLAAARSADAAPWACVSNLPYNVAVPVVVRLLEERRDGRRASLVMVQREVGERLAAGPGDEQYGAVSVKVAYYAEAPGRGPRAADRVHAHAQGRLGAGAAAPPDARRRSSVPSADAPVRARCGPASRSGARCCGARCARCWATHAPTCSRRPGSTRPRAPRRSGSTTGPRWPAARRRPHEAAHAVRATAYPKLTCRCACSVAAPTATTSSNRWSSRSVSPTTSSRSSRSRHPGACRWSAGHRGRRGRAVRPHEPRVHRRREAAGARGPVGSRRAPRAAQADPRRRRARRRIGRRRGRAARGARGCSTSTSTTRACSRSRPRSGPTCRSACGAARRGCAGAARCIEPVSVPHRARRSWSRSRRSGCRRPTSTGRGTSSAARGRTRVGARAAPVAPVIARAGQRPRAGGRGACEPRLVEFRERARGRRRARPRCSRAAARPTWCPSPTPAAPGARRRGGPSPARAGRRHDERQPRRPPRQLTPSSASHAVACTADAPKASRRASGPADDAASASSSAASCASSSACACGAS